MKKIIKSTLLMSILFLPPAALGWQWRDFWLTADQQAASLLKENRPKEAAIRFRDENWKAVASYRSGNYSQAFQLLYQKNSSDAQYNAGNAAALDGHFQQAIAAYDKAIALNSNNRDAISNRELIKKLLNQQKQPNKVCQNPKKNSAAADKNNLSRNKADQSNKNHQPDKNDQIDKHESLSQANANQKMARSKRLQAENENNNQLLRRVADDPGGLLRQKFLRDYYKRHTADATDSF